MRESPSRERKSSIRQVSFHPQQWSRGPTRPKSIEKVEQTGTVFGVYSRQAVLRDPAIEVISQLRGTVHTLCNDEDSSRHVVDSRGEKKTPPTEKAYSRGALSQRGPKQPASRHCTLRVHGSDLSKLPRSSDPTLSGLGVGVPVSP